MRALIDGDILVYRCGFAGEQTHYRVYLAGEEEYGWIQSFRYKKDLTAWINGEDDKYTVSIEKEYEPLENVLHTVKQVISKIKWAVRATEYEVYLTSTDKSNFRFSVAKTQTYKGNRPDAKPIYYDEIREYLVKYHNATVVTGIEADDAMGIAQWNQLMSNAMDEYMPETTICTIDKDLDMIPGFHYHFVNNEKYWVDEVEASRNFYKQILQGDKTDNIPGLYHFTGKRCTKQILAGLDTINNIEDMYPYVLDVFVAAGTKNERECVNFIEETSTLLWILREPLNETDKTRVSN